MVSTLVSSVRGTLESVGPDWADVDIGGVTLRVSVPDSTLRSIGPAGGQVRLLTTLQVREDSLTLFGFGTEEERSIFEALTAINGVGPRLALGVPLPAQSRLPGRSRTGGEMPTPSRPSTAWAKRRPDA